MDEDKRKFQERQTLKGDRQDAIRKIKALSSDDDSISGNITLARILGGDILTGRMIKSQMGTILLIVIMLFVYISNKYICNQEIQQIDKLRTTLTDAKYKALTTSSILTEKSRLSKIMDLLKENNDSDFITQNIPPYIIVVPE